MSSYIAPPLKAAVTREATLVGAPVDPGEEARAAAHQTPTDPPQRRKEECPILKDVLLLSVGRTRKDGVAIPMTDAALNSDRCVPSARRPAAPRTVLAAAVVRGTGHSQRADPCERPLRVFGGAPLCHRPWAR